MRAVLDRLVVEGTAVARADGRKHEIFPVAASAAEGQALREWVLRERAEKTIEVGLGYGISTLFICEGLLLGGAASPHHVAIDPHQRSRFADCGLQFLEDAGVSDLVEYHSEGSELLLPRLVTEERRFDLAYVDGNHRFDGVFVDLFYLGRLVREGAVIFLDDYQLPAIQRAVAFYVTNLAWSAEEISTPNDLHQWVALRTSTQEDARSYD